MSGKRSLNTKIAIKSLIVFGAVVAAYVVLNLVLPRRMNWFALTYIAQPLLWLIVAAVTLLISKYSTQGKLVFNRSLIKLAVLVGFFSTLAFFVAGLFFGLSQNPNLFTLKAVVLNLALIACPLIGMELSRAYLINIFTRRYFTLGLAFTALLYAAISISLPQLAGLRNPGQIMAFVGGTTLPAFAHSLVACLLAFLGGPLASLTYRGVLELFRGFSPILPKLPWAVTGFMGIIISVISILFIGSLHRERLPEAKGKPEKTSSMIGWVAVAIVSLAILWFFLGLFGSNPIVIAGRSMNPAMKLGDIAMVSKISPESIKKGNIIHFTAERGSVIHRVIKIQREGNLRVFITKGDANNTVDSRPVRADQIEGKVSFVIPKLGWAAIVIKNALTTSQKSPRRPVDSPE